MYRSSKTVEERYPEWEAAHWLKKFTFSVPNRMLAGGQTKELTFDDLTSQPEKDMVNNTLKAVEKNWKESKSFWFIPRLMVSLIKSFPGTMIVILIGTILEGATKILNPILLMSFLNALTSESEGSDEDENKKYYYATALAGVSTFYVLIHHILFFYSMRIGWNWRTVTQALVYKHLLSLDSSSLENTSKGNMVNLISNDVDKFERFTVFMCFGVVAPFELILVYFLLSSILDYYAALSGIAITLMFLPLEVKIGAAFARIRTATAANTDKRIRHINESIEGISTVKGYGWETPFFALIKKLRGIEVSTISQSQALKAVNKAFDYCMVPTSNLVMQYVFWLRGGELTLPKMFACLLYLQVIRVSVFVHWTQGVELGSESIASCYRLEKFLGLEKAKGKNTSDADAKVDAAEEEVVPLMPSGSGDIELTEAKHNNVDEKKKNNNDTIISVKNMSFCYGSGGVDNTTTSTTPPPSVLSNISIDILRNELVIVVGPVGAGKSSFLAALLGELNQISEDGTVRATPCFFKSNGDNSTDIDMNNRPRIAYCPQIPWIFSASVKENVVVSSESLDRTKYDEELYELAMSSSCINEDLKQLPNGDDTEIGEKGVSISGGQKARLALARAVYSDTEVYLLDDPLSAVDAHVSRALLEDCIIATLKQRGKTVILCTHQLQYLKHADKILVLNENGSMKYCGSYNELQQNKNKNEILLQLEEDVLRSRTMSSDSNRSRGKSISEIDDQTFSIVKDEDKVIKDISNPKEKEKEKVELINMIEKEGKASGNISGSVYVQWMRSGGLIRGILCFALIAASQAVLMVHEYWLRWWIEDKFHLTDSQYLWIMGVMTPVVYIFGYCRVKQFFNFTIKASSELHQKSLWAILHSPLAFFTSNPTGRILNRFSKDQSQADEALPQTFFDFFACSATCVGAVILVCISMPILMVTIPLFIIAFLFFRRKYMASMREIKRHEAMSRSPIYAGFSATLDGLSSIRAYKLQNKMSHIFYDYLDENGRAWWSYLMAARWFGFRMDGLAITVLIFTAYGAAFYSDSVDKGLLGFALVYSMNLAGLFQWTVRLSAEVESMMTAVERISQYSLLPHEEGYSTTFETAITMIEGNEFCASTASNDLKNGNVDINNLVVKYREDLNPVLNGLTVNIPSGTKCGVVGRTGSGKSTLLSALLRLNIVSEGSSVTIGGVDLLNMSLEDARSAITVIPQQPNLFLGSIRFNLDPFDIYTDDECWSALENANIADFVKSSNNGLEFHVEEGGNNLSVGQKQLFSMARAILRKTRIILMDEVTASVDYETDSSIQKTIRTTPTLRDATIITVAHRLQTIADSDTIIVISDGKLVETGTPLELLNTTGSFFEALVKKSGEEKLIRQLATREK
jgi:ATP-binding cassette, subfamily C (CFTR/MRP), member 4